jgi:hypothetical protein
MTPSVVQNTSCRMVGGIVKDWKGVGSARHEETGGKDGNPQSSCCCG